MWRRRDGSASSKLVLQDLDLIPTDLQWGPGANEVRFESGTKGQTQIFSLNLLGGKFAPVTSGEAAFHAFDINARAGIMTWLSNTFEKLDDLYVSSLDGKDVRQLTPRQCEAVERSGAGSCEPRWL